MQGAARPRGQRSRRRPSSRTSPSRCASIRCRSALPAQAKPPRRRSAGGKAGARLALPDKPSIAVLPFQNMSGDPEQEYFADGMVEDIITGLSRIKWLFVIARNSSFIYKGKAVDIRQVGRELGVRYVLGGRRAQGGQSAAHHRAADRGRDRRASLGRPIRRRAGRVFELQDQITDKVVGIVEPSLQRSEIERARQKRPENLDAYDLYLRALPLFRDAKARGRQDRGGVSRKRAATGPELRGGSCAARIVLSDDLHPGRQPRSGQDRGARARARGHRRDRRTTPQPWRPRPMVIGHLGGDHRAAIDTIKNALAINPSSATVNYTPLTSINLPAITLQGRAPRRPRAALSPRDPLAFQAYLRLRLQGDA